MKIGISGAKGSFSEKAAKYHTNEEGIGEYQLEYLVSVERVLTALDKKDIDKGVFPIENSNGGIVYEAVYAMSKHMFFIEKIFEIDIKHCLLVKKGVKAHDIVTIASHDQALKQCRMYLKRVWQNVELQEYADTAKAAKDLGAGELFPTTAVIASKNAAELYELDVLEESIQDLKFNFTTFIVGVKM